MSQYASGTPNTFTPTAATTSANAIVLTVLTAGQLARVKMFNWGGASLTSTAYVTQWARITNTAVTPTARLIVSNNPGTTPIATCNTYGTAAACTADQYLFKQSWNLLGGGGGIVLPIGGEWHVTGGALGTLYSQIGVGNITGADANSSSYGMTWEE
jgi:hypothetical protein